MRLLGNIFYDDNWMLFNQTWEDAIELLPKNSIDLIITSTEYPRLRGSSFKTEEQWFSWFRGVLEQTKRPLKKSGVLVQNIMFPRLDGWFNPTIFDLKDVYLNLGFNMIDVIPWINPNPPPRGNMKKNDHSGWEFCFLITRDKNYTYRPWHQPYAPKTLGKLKPGNSTRKPDVVGSLAGGHSKRLPEGARQPNYIIESNTVSGRPRIKGGVFPLNLARRFIHQYSNKGDVVLDPCSGSGTVIVSAIKQGRYGVGFEPNLENLEVAVKWIEDTKV